MPSEPSSPPAQGMLLRFLRLIQCAGGNAAAERDEAEPATLRYRLRGRLHAFPATVEAHCLDHGLISRDRGRLAITCEGEAWLRRRLHPDEPFLAQHAELATRTIRIQGDARTVLVNEAESPLARLHLRKDANGESWLDEACFRAGERLRADFEKARLQPRISANWEASVSAGGRGPEGGDICGMALDARRRVEAALAVLEDELAGVALDVCCFLKGLEQVERERRWPPRSAKLMLRTALAALGRHYGMVAGSGARRRADLHWGAPDYRPSP
jgi:hypothetical protein